MKFNVFLERVNKKSDNYEKNKYARKYVEGEYIRQSDDFFEGFRFLSSFDYAQYRALMALPLEAMGEDFIEKWVTDFSKHLNDYNFCLPLALLSSNKVDTPHLRKTLSDLVNSPHWDWNKFSRNGEMFAECIVNSPPEKIKDILALPRPDILKNLAALLHSDPERWSEVLKVDWPQEQLVIAAQELIDFKTIHMRFLTPQQRKEKEGWVRENILSTLSRINTDLLTEHGFKVFQQSFILAGMDQQEWGKDPRSLDPKNRQGLLFQALSPKAFSQDFPPFDWQDIVKMPQHKFIEILYNAFVTKYEPENIAEFRTHFLKIPSRFWEKNVLRTLNYRPYSPKNQKAIALLISHVSQKEKIEMLQNILRVVSHYSSAPYKALVKILIKDCSPEDIQKLSAEVGPPAQMWWKETFAKKSRRALREEIGAKKSTPTSLRRM